MNDDKYENYKGIKSKNLLTEEIHNEDMIKVKQIINKEILSSIIGLFIIIFSLYCFAKGFFINKSNTGKIILSAFFILFLSFGISLIKDIISLLFNKYHKAEYGIIKNKYSVHINSNLDRLNTSNNYYIDVKFPNNKTYINKVTCFDDDYKNLDISKKVLVLCFNKTSYAISTKN